MTDKMATATNNPVDISLVVPVRNEAGTLAQLIRRIRQTLNGQRFEVILVDDGSTDGSLGVMRALAALFPQIRYLGLGGPTGKTAALAAGFSQAAGDVIVTLDGDLQNRPEDIPRLLSALAVADFAIGHRVARKDAALRRLSSRIAKAVRNRVIEEPITDVGCGFAAFRRRCLEVIPLYDGMHRFFPALFRIAGFQVKAVTVGHDPRRYGHSKYGVRNRLWRGLVDLLAVRWMMNRTIAYRIAEAGPVNPDPP